MRIQQGGAPRPVSIQRVAGERFVVALERLMGLVLVAVSIEMMLRGVKTFVTQLAHP